MCPAPVASQGLPLIGAPGPQPLDRVEVFYGYLPLGNGADPRLTFVVDETEASSWVAWIDRNNNEDLTDDGAPCRNEGTGRLACLVTVDIEVRDRTGRDHRLPYQLWFWLAGPDASAVDPSRIPWRPLFYARYHYEGTVALAGTRYRAIAYEMFNHDGVFSEADLCVDLDDDGRCADDERVAADGALAVGGFSYRIRIR